MRGSLPSAAIDTSELVPVDVVIQRNHLLKKESTIGKLACRIACEAVFGPAIMKQCTPFGTKTLPGLPQDELYFMKQTVFSFFPQYWANPIEFEVTWKTCVRAMQQACKRPRLGHN